MRLWVTNNASGSWNTRFLHLYRLSRSRLGENLDYKFLE